MIKKILFVLLIAAGIIKSSPVYVNQAGYLLNSEKLVYFSVQADSFFVNDFASSNILFRGKIQLWKTNDPATGLTIYRGDFSSFNSSGKYFITDNLGNKSVVFTIADTVYNSVFKKSLKGFYFQRCGTTLLSKNAGAYQHPACHINHDGTFHSTSDSTGNANVIGGWHDAGDYGKYVVNAGVTVGTLLAAFEMFPDRFMADDLNIPESGNNVPDILDEVKYELDWLFKMQRANGAVFAKVTRMNFSGFIMPQYDNEIRYIYQAASTATADFAAMMARAARVYKKYDADYASKCLTAAVKAWNYLEAHPLIFPSGGFRNPSGTNTGEYGDGNDTDERLWASAELFLATGEQKYNTFFLNNYKSNGVFTGSMGWPNLRPLAQLTYLFGDNTLTDANAVSTLRMGLLSYCNSLVTRTQSDGFNLTLNMYDYNWGCNSDVLNKAIMLLAGYTIFNNQPYYNAALSQMNYILGTNAHNISFITGIGEKSVLHPHHRPSGADNIAAPVPGLLAGGPDRNLSDNSLKAKYNSKTPPALCYLDIQDSYASNEICINWNAPLVFVAGYFNNGEK
jgi:endoglucanase